MAQEKTSIYLSGHAYDCQVSDAMVTTLCLLDQFDQC